MKRFMALMLALVLCLMLGVTAFAENPNAEQECGILDAAALDKLIEDYCANWPHTTEGRFSVGLSYTATGDSYYYNGDAWYYPGSTYKVPVSMLASEDVYNGKIALEDIIPNQRGNYSLQDLEYSAIVYSDNNAGHILVEYSGGSYYGKCSDMIAEKYTTLDKSYYDHADFHEYSYYSSRFINEVLMTLYEGGERFPKIIDYMKQSMPGHYFKQSVTEYEVAQKYGALVDTSGNDWNNTIGIIYTENPIIISVFTKNMTSYEAFIAGMARLLTDYALTVDEALPAYLASQQPEPTAETEEPEQSEETDEEENDKPLESPKPSEQPKETEKHEDTKEIGLFSNISPVYSIIVAALAVISLVLYIISVFFKDEKKGGRR